MRKNFLSRAHEMLSLAPEINFFYACPFPGSVHLLVNSARLNVVVLYRPLSSVNFLYDELEDMLDEVTALSGQLLLCGEFNSPSTIQLDPHLSDIRPFVGYGYDPACQLSYAQPFRTTRSHDHASSISRHRIGHR